jgi:hypothetical protein
MNTSVKYYVLAHGGIAEPLRNELCLSDQREKDDDAMTDGCEPQMAEPQRDQATAPSKKRKKQVNRAWFEKIRGLTVLWTRLHAEQVQDELDEATLQEYVDLAKAESEIYHRTQNAAGIAMFRSVVPKVTSYGFPRIVDKSPRGTQSTSDARYAKTCLVDALRSLGVKAAYTSDGPFWAMEDGNRMLQPFSKHLHPISTTCSALPVGKYVLGSTGHFVALRV